ncbi:MAG: hypothetical protein H7Z42_05545 [Roseiflexaceae bacterium]|nr:hypothetical protein [Roseiflexaceae bacterium]
MSDFQTVVTAEDAAPDLSKHVNYVQGMVLGVDDFTQEFAYLNGRTQWLAREAIGYGALSGLHVTVEPTGDGPRVRVAAGVALTLRGELVCVHEDQCALINLWLAENHPKLPPGLDQTLYVQLCYKTCATDNLPIPGEPCRSEDELMAASRIADNFRLELTTTPPDQREEDMVRAFAAWLRNVRLTNDLNAATSEQEFVEAVREAWADGSELSAMPPETLFIPTDSQSDYLRLALRIWATELRPAARAIDSGCANPPDEGCIALAMLEMRVTLDRREAVDLPAVRDERAPFLLHLRMLQEWLIAGRRDVVPSDTVLAETVYGLAPDAGVAEEYARADHTHGTPLLPELLGDVASFPAPPDSIPSIPDEPDHRIWTTVVAIQGTPVAPEPPTEAGQVLVFNGSAWEPGSVSTGIEAGDTVVVERAYGLGAAVGDSLQYAHANHTHGTPPPPELVGDVTSNTIESDGSVYRLETRVARIYGEDVGVPGEVTPVPGQVLKLMDMGDGVLEWRAADASAGAGGPAPSDTVVTERTYGQNESFGELLSYARTDHTHGTPPAPTFTGEVEIVATQSTDTSQQYGTRVAQIIGIPVVPNDREPAEGDILTLVDPGDGNLQWQLGSRGGKTSGSFVVAAGQFGVDGTPVSSFGQLEAIRVGELVYVLVFPAYTSEQDYVVTGSPWARLSTPNPHVFEYIGKLSQVFRDVGDDRELQEGLIRLLRSGSDGLVVRAQQMEFDLNQDGAISRMKFSEVTQGFMVEISLYPRQR